MSFELFCFIFLCGIICIRLQYLDYRSIRYNDYLRKFNKSYSDEEFQRRLIYFEESLKEIEKLNSGRYSTGAVHGLTKFSDWSKKEFSKNFLLKEFSCSNHRARVSQSVRLPGEQESFDWRNHKGVIGPVDNQKMCNACWAFGIVRVMESMAAINKLGYDRLSVQQLIDCNTIKQGCNGGDIDTAMDFLRLNRYNITTEDNYPLVLVKQTCKRPLKVGRGIKNYKIRCDVPDDVLVEKLFHGPVMAVVSSTANWMNYNSGVIQRNCPKKQFGMVHVVTIIGYDTTYDENGEVMPYFIIKNTWGSDWGENGYIRIARSKKNLCGIYNHIGFLDVI